MTEKIYVLATVEVADECMARAKDWHAQPSQTMFVHGGNGFIAAVAEFLANEKGFTLYECNAKYPKDIDK